MGAPHTPAGGTIPGADLGRLPHTHARASTSPKGGDHVHAAAHTCHPPSEGTTASERGIGTKQRGPSSASTPTQADTPDRPPGRRSAPVVATSIRMQATQELASHVANKVAMLSILCIAHTKAHTWTARGAV